MSSGSPPRILGAMNRTLMAATAALVLAVVLVVFLSQGDGERGAGSDPPPQVSAEEDPEPESPAALATPRDLPRPKAAAEDGARTTLEAPVVDEGEGLLLRVEADGRPVDGAEVFAAPLHGLPTPPAAVAELDAWMEEHGQRQRTDGDGLARLKLPESPPLRMLVMARHGGLWGRGRFSPPEDANADPRVLTLAPDHTLVAEVVDPGGRPLQGVGVELQRDHGGWQEDLAQATTDAAGRARLPHAQVHRNGGAAERWILAVDALLPERLVETLDPKALPVDPVRFTLPATGSVHVNLKDTGGNLWEGSANVTLNVVPPGERAEVSPFSSERRARLKRSVEGGRAEFERVGLGLRLSAFATRQAGQVRSRVTFPGPMTAGELVQADLSFGSQHPVIVVRLVTPEGSPLVDQPVTVSIEHRSDVLSGNEDQRPITDAEGRLRLDLSPTYREGDGRVAHILLSREDGPDHRGRLDLGRVFPEGETDLGDVTVGPPVVFVAGRVVDDAGRGVGHADLVLSRKTGDKPYWDQVWEFRHRSQEDGTFEIYDDVEGVSWRLGATKDAWLALATPFDRGQTDLELRATSAGSIAGSVLLDEDIPGDLIEIEFEAVDRKYEETFLRWDDSRAGLGSQGGFERPGLHPGVYNVIFRVEGVRDAVNRIEGVPVVSGDTTRDPRLQPLDLRGTINAFRITLVTPDAKAIGNGNLKFDRAGAEELQCWKWFQSEEFTLLSPHPAIDVNIDINGYLQARLRDLRGDAEVELSTGLTVRVVLNADAPLPEPPIYIKPALTSVDGGSAKIDFGADAFDDSREVRLRAVEPGTMRVVWILERRASSGAMAMQREVEPEQRVEILPGVEDQRIEVHLSADQMATLLEAFDD